MQSLGLLLYLGLVPSALAYAMFFTALRTLPATASAVAVLLEPVTAALLAWALIGERLGAAGPGRRRAGPRRGGGDGHRPLSLEGRQGEQQAARAEQHLEHRDEGRPVALAGEQRQQAGDDAGDAARAEHRRGAPATDDRQPRDHGLREREGDAGRDERQDDRGEVDGQQEPAHRVAVEPGLTARRPVQVRHAEEHRPHGGGVGEVAAVVGLEHARQRVARPGAAPLGMSLRVGPHGLTQSGVRGPLRRARRPAAARRARPPGRGARLGRLLLWDHITYSAPTSAVLDPWIALAAIAMTTERVAIGPLVTPLSRRRVHKLARETATLDQLSAGRLILGVGLGSDRHGELAPFGEVHDPKQQAVLLDDGLDQLVRYWDGAFDPRPVQRPRIPVWCAATWPNRRPLRRAARWDGLFPVRVPEPDALAEMAGEALRAARRGRRPVRPGDHGRARPRPRPRGRPRARRGR